MITRADFLVVLLAFAVVTFTVAQTHEELPIEDPAVQGHHVAPYPGRLRFNTIKANAPEDCNFQCGYHGLCINKTCVCDVGFKGDNCSEELVCGGHGSYNNDTKKCECESGWYGADCRLGACPKDCSGRGLCYHDQHYRPSCVCLYGYRGEDCSLGGCPNNCSGHGACVEVAAGDGDETVAICRCDAGWRNQDCSAVGCPVCVHGKCVDDKCVCDAGYSKADCSERVCSDNCTLHGTCNDGTCVCNAGWAGDDCMVNSTLCPGNCNMRGKCTQNGCECLSQYGGASCEKECPNNCNMRGQCVKGECVCVSPFAPPDCSTVRCKDDCNGANGVCNNGACLCVSPWSGPSCAVKQCPNLCSSHGVCNNGTCTCEGPVDPTKPYNNETNWYLGYQGADCSQRICLNNCSSRGACDAKTGKCVCNKGATGADCSRTYCADDCSGHGSCPDKETGCVCDYGYKGLGCETQYCVNNCNAALSQGRCDNQSCRCEAGFTGRDCSQVKCPTALPDNSTLKDVPLPNTGVSIPGADSDPDPLACSRNGVCVSGKCACFQGWKGVACHEKTCPASCNNVGICMDGTCHCNDGFSGADCSKIVVKTTVDCPNNCSGHGICRNGVCLCEHGKYFGSDCSKVRIPCPGACALNGVCDITSGKCVCNQGRIGEDCSTQVCAPAAGPKANCSGNGVCTPNDASMYGICRCFEDYAGPSCADKKCDDPCNGHGECLNYECFCQPGWGGFKCSKELCPNKCGGHGRCADEGCECDPGYAGDDCSIAKVRCPVFNCSNHGECQILPDRTKPEGAVAVCKCQNGYQGAGCERPICPKGCNEPLGQGVCASPGVCKCDPKFFGETCDKPACPKDCSGHGTCENGECRCMGKWGGVDCATELGCNATCEIHGTCQGSQCVCDDGFFGYDCEKVWCPANCSNHGRCEQGLCLCDPGFSGEACAVLVDEALCVSSCEFKCDGIKSNQISQEGGTIQTKESCVDQCVTTSCSSKLKGSQAAKAEFREIIRRRAEAIKENKDDALLTPTREYPDESTETHIWF